MFGSTFSKVDKIIQKCLDPPFQRWIKVDKKIEMLFQFKIKGIITS